MVTAFRPFLDNKFSIAFHCSQDKVLNWTEHRTRTSKICTHHYIIITEEFTALKTPCTPPIHPFVLCPQTLVTTYLLTVSRVLPFPGCHIAGIIQCTPFSDWLLSFSNNQLRFLSFFMACRLIFFNHWILFHHMDIPQFTHFPTEGYLVCFWQLSLFFISLNCVFYTKYLIHKIYKQVLFRERLKEYH